MDTKDRMKVVTDVLYAIPRFTKKPSLEHTKKLLKKLGVYDTDAKIIHVAGTNGKGSVCNYLQEALLKSGLHVGLFTSPHLVTINERIRVDGKIIDDDTFLAAYDEVSAVADKTSTFFEYLLAIAMVVYAKFRLDYIILETGMGGRLDQTNVYTDKALSVITEIGYDHMQYLGDTLELIASEKAGIIWGGDVVYLDKRVEASSVIKKRIEQVHATGYAVDKTAIEIISIEGGLSFRYRTIDGQTKIISSNAVALYQAENLAITDTAVDVLSRKDSRIVKPKRYDSIWEGRMEEVAPCIYVDGAHNEDGVDAFVSYVEYVRSRGDDSSNVLFYSNVSDKDYKAMIRRICKEHVFDKVYIMQVGKERASDLALLKAEYEKYGYEPVIVESMDETVRLMKEESVLHKVYAAGSLYLVGEIKKVLKGLL